MILHVFMLQIAYTTIFQWPWNKHYLVSHEPVIAHLFLIWFLMFIDGSDTNNFESWTTKDHLSPKFLRFFFCIICLISIHLLTILTKKQSYSMPCSHSFLFIIKQQQTIKEISILVMAAILNGGCHSFWLIKKQQWTIEEISIFSNSSHHWMMGETVGHNFERGPPKGHPCQIWFNLVQQFQRRWFKCDLLLRYA